MLTVEEASKILADKLKQFEDENGEIDILKAVTTIYNNPLIYENNHGFQWQIKAVRDAVETPEACLHHHRIWEWVGLKLIKAFDTRS